MEIQFVCLTHKSVRLPLRLRLADRRFKPQAFLPMHVVLLAARLRYAMHESNRTFLLDVMCRAPLKGFRFSTSPSYL